MPVSYDSKDNLLRHSEAKVTLLGEYLRNYLSVLANSRYTNRINIFDVFCGRGIYENEKEGSPLVILRAVKEVYSYRMSKGQAVPKIDCYFADKNSDNVESVANAIASRQLADSAIGEISVETKPYSDSLFTIVSKLSARSEKSFIFIDPYGYSDVRASQIKGLLERGAEVLLFLPTSFMYRFEGEGRPDALRQFIEDLGGWKPAENKSTFVEQLRDSFREFMGNGMYVSTFLIEKDANTLYSLFFFTTNVRGHERMIDAKWAVDIDAGQGWSFRRVPGQERLIPDLETFYLEKDLLEFLRSGPKDNCDVYRFAVIVHEYKPTHAKRVCEKLITEGIVVKRNLGGLKSAKGLYINCDHYTANSRKVVFEVAK